MDTCHTGHQRSEPSPSVAGRRVPRRSDIWVDIKGNLRETRLPCAQNRPKPKMAGKRSTSIKVKSRKPARSCEEPSLWRTLAITKGATHESAPMLLYRLRERIFQFEGGVSPRFPTDAIVHVALAPEVPFGGVPGTSRNAVTDTTGKARVNLSTGRAVLEWDKPLFGPVTASTAIAGTAFEASKNVVSVRSQCTSEQDLTDLLAAVFYAFPAVLNLYIPDAPFPTYAWGQWEQQGSAGYLSQRKL